jgi:hypothetical protein
MPTQPSSIDDQLIALVRLAMLAPSGHNTQPWKFAVEGASVWIMPDYSRRLPVVDPDDHALFISLGCALENLVIGARHSGWSPEVEYFPDSRPDCLVVHLRLKSAPTDTLLFQAIPQRQSTRRAYDGQPVPPAVIRRLEEASRQDGVDCHVYTEPRDVEPLIDFIKEGNRRQFRDPAFVDELLAWIRFSRGEAKRSGDGLSAAVMGLPWVPRWVGKAIMKLLVGPEGEARRVEKLIRSSAGLLLFVARDNDKRTWVNVGRSFERVALTSTAFGLKHAHLNMPCEVLEVRRQLASHLGLGSAQPLLLLRFGYASPMPRSSRRRLDEVLD